MTTARVPGLPIPDWLRGRERGTWAHTTITVRLPNIAERTLDENDFEAQRQARIEALIAEIPNGPIRELETPGALDAAAWNAYVRPYRGQDWLQPPWFFAETYFYRRILEATGYFEPGPGEGHDPFHYQKEQGLIQSREAIAGLAAQLAELIEGGWQRETLGRLLALDLWGNQADLSLWPAGDSSQPGHEDPEAAREQILVDDTILVTGYVDEVLREHALRVDVLADNAGLELVSDLMLVDYLLSTHTAGTAVLHLKIHPTFVSDAMVVDVEQTVDFLRNEEDEHVRAFAERLAVYLESGRLQLDDHPFWTSPLPFWQMPEDLRQTLQQSDLIISKGDANYRRLLGDRHWPYTTSFAEIMRYTPAPLLALRTLKAEIASGLRQEQIDTLTEQDPGWLTNGRWGVIQLAMPQAL